MVKRIKSFAMMLLALSLPVGAVFATTGKPSSVQTGVQQNNQCTGVVRDASGEAIVGASVLVKGTTNATITRIDGDFALSNVKRGDVIVFSFVGFVSKEVVYNGSPLNP